MFFLERCARTIRRLPILRSAGFFWDIITPAYEYLLRLIYGDILRRCINEDDIIYVPFRLRHFTDKYETAFFKKVMDEVRRGDVVADVGAFFGFYTFAFAKRAGLNGRVVAFEADPKNLAFLKDALKRYNKGLKPEISGYAVGEGRKKLKFDSQGAYTSGVIYASVPKGEVKEVDCISLDEFFAREKVDIIKIDVEGYEGNVLMGAVDILRRENGCPRAVFIEAHPYAWGNYSMTDKIILSILRDAGYKIINVDGQEVRAINEYGNIIAVKD